MLCLFKVVPCLSVTTVDVTQLKMVWNLIFEIVLSFCKLFLHTVLTTSTICHWNWKLPSFFCQFLPVTNIWGKYILVEFVGFRHILSIINYYHNKVHNVNTRHLTVTNQLHVHWLNIACIREVEPRKRAHVEKRTKDTIGQSRSSELLQCSGRDMASLSLFDRYYFDRCVLSENVALCLVKMSKMLPRVSLAFYSSM